MTRLLAFVPFVLVALALMVPQRPADAEDGDAGEESVFLGAGSCAAQACHGGGAADDEVWRSSYKVWSGQDAHAKAEEVLTNELGRRIGKRLGIDPATSAQCLNCHGTLPELPKAKTFDEGDGVSCELCHGAAGDWLGEHTKPKWQDYSAEKKAEFGLKDLSTAANRAATCVECHVGGPGRDITHDIMAAGHPPLEFDFGRFQDKMTPHWHPKKNLFDAKSWLTGTRTVAQAQLAHAARLADGTKNGAPDFTAFDCASCHHPIYTDSQYERHGPAGGKPGDLPLELSGWSVFHAATGTDPAAKRPEPFPRVAQADSGMRMADQARTAAKALADVAGNLDAATIRANLKRRLAAIAGGSTRATRAEMRLLAMAAWSLTPAETRDGDAFKSAWADSDAALAATTRFDERAAAAAVRRLLAAGG